MMVLYWCFAKNQSANEFDVIDPVEFKEVQDFIKQPPQTCKAVWFVPGTFDYNGNSLL